MCDHSGSHVNDRWERGKIRGKETSWESLHWPMREDEGLDWDNGKGKEERGEIRPTGWQ